MCVCVYKYPPRYTPHCFLCASPCTCPLTGDDSHGHTERVVVRGADHGGVRRADHPHVPLRGRRRRPRTRHHQVSPITSTPVCASICVEVGSI